MLSAIMAPVWAQDDAHAGHTAEQPAPMMNHDAMPGMDHAGHGAGQAMNNAETPPPGQDAMPAMDHSAHAAMPSAKTMSGLRDPHAYADGYSFSQFPMRHVEHELNYGLLRFDRFETVRASGDTFTIYDLQASYGSNFERAVIKTEGDIIGKKIADANTELLWRHAVAAYWDTQFGLRHENDRNQNWSWLAAGVQGLAPYWFEVDATAYLGEAGRVALKLGAEYELLLTQKWILQPRIGIDFNGQNDAARSVGAGLSDVTAGVRLRYEIRREVAPYAGVAWVGKFGGTADYVHAAGLNTREIRVMAGVRLWY
ncbi:MAG: copper resistance protein B [Pseudomonadota bacterium]